MFVSQLISGKDRIHGFCDKYCDKLFPEKIRITDKPPLFRVKGE